MIPKNVAAVLEKTFSNSYSCMKFDVFSSIHSGSIHKNEKYSVG